MADSFIALNCHNCGSKLQVYGDMERFACSYCGTEMIVQRRGGTIELRPVEAAIRKVQVGTDKTAAELARPRLQDELTSLVRAEQAIISERIEIRQTSNYILIGFGGTLGVLLVGIFSVYAVAAEADNPAIGVVACCVVCLVLVALIARKASDVHKRERAQSLEEARPQEENKAHRLDAVRSRIARVQRQLAENYKILND